jgi:hypothetical protein
VKYILTEQEATYRHHRFARDWADNSGGNLLPADEGLSSIFGTRPPENFIGQIM